MSEQKNSFHVAKAHLAITFEDSRGGSFTFEAPLIEAKVDVSTQFRETTVNGMTINLDPIKKTLELKADIQMAGGAAMVMTRTPALSKRCKKSKGKK